MLDLVVDPLRFGKCITIECDKKVLPLVIVEPVVKLITDAIRFLGKEHMPLPTHH